MAYHAPKVLSRSIVDFFYRWLENFDFLRFYGSGNPSTFQPPREPQAEWPLSSVISQTQVQEARSSHGGSWVRGHVHGISLVIFGSQLHRTDNHPTVPICKCAISDSRCFFQVLHQNGVHWRFRTLVHDLLDDPIHASPKDCKGRLKPSEYFSTPDIFFKGWQSTPLGRIVQSQSGPGALAPGVRTLEAGQSDPPRQRLSAFAPGVYTFKRWQSTSLRRIVRSRSGAGALAPGICNCGRVAIRPS